MAIANRLNSVIDAWANKVQRGFIRGRNMLQNVLELETYAVARAFAPSSAPALVLSDYAAAFPSIAREFIWIALKAIGIPEDVIRAIRGLYINNIHYTRSTSGLRFAFVVLAGVRQGCPLSSTLFILVTDCILNAICQNLGPKDIVMGVC